MTNTLLLRIKSLVKTEMRKTDDSQHGLSHLLRVKDNALKIVKILGVEKKLDLNLLKSICLLHDLTYVSHKTGFISWILERKIVKKEVLKLLDEIKVDSKEKKIILTAVCFHPHAFPLRRLNQRGNLYTKILQDSDTLDQFSKIRLASFKKECFSSFGGKIKFYLLSPFICFGEKKLKWFLNYPFLINDFSLS